MNFLAHLYLADDTPASIVGNMLADFVSHDFRERYPPPVVNAILFHHQIDHYADAHPLFRRSRRRLGRQYRLLTGVLIDVFYDHFLARNWGHYSRLPLAAFCDEVYAVFQDHPHLLSPRLQRIMPIMVEENWLLAYREIEGVEKALRGLSRRISRPNRLAEGGEALRENYAELQTDFQAFFPDLKAHADGIRHRYPSNG